MAISKISGSGLGTINSPVEFTSADNLTQLTLSSTDADANSGPNLDFYRNSASPADNDLLAKIRIQGKNDAGQQVLYSFIDTYALDVTDGTEDGGFYIYRMMGGSSVESLSFTATEAVFNESSGDYDFRVESNGNANMLFVDGGNDSVGIGTATPLVVNGVTFTGTHLMLKGAAHTRIVAEGGSSGQVLLTDLGADANTKTKFIFSDGGKLQFGSTNDAGSNTMHMQIDATGAVTMPLQPAFLVHPATGQNNIPVNAVTTLVMGTERFDQNADFASNTFTAPVTGRYLLNVNIYAQNLDVDTSYYQLELATSNRTYFAVKSLAGNDADVTYHNFVINVLADMDASDTAFVRFNIPNSGTAQMDIITASSFSGNLVC
jgi:hypothetical protein